MKQLVRINLIWLVLVSVTSFSYADEKLDFFEKKIRPVLISKCYECHSTGSAEIKGGLLLDSRESLLAGGESGETIVPGKPEVSLLISSLRHESFEMPPDEQLPPEVIADFVHWIKEGAVDPRDNPPSPDDVIDQVWKAKLAERSHWWSLQPPQPVSPPDVNNSVWNHEPIDRFIYAQLSEHGLAPSPQQASPEVLIRRLSFVLTGLPPKPEQVQAFVTASSSNPVEAYENLVDQLLASPHFGERIARHWMDVVRYTDTYGYEWDITAKGSWEYRDYLIRAFNQDVSYDQLVREQIAGDLLPEPRINKEMGLNESLIGPMFYHMGEHRHGSSLEFNGIHQEMIDNKIDAFSKTFLGMTVACARCHDHKLDAISQKDYYALAGIFMTPRWSPRVIDTPDKYESEIDELKSLRADISGRLRQMWQESQSLTPENLQAWAESHQDANDVQNQNFMEIIPRSILQTKDENISDYWEELVRSWQKNREIRVDYIQKNLTLITDFSTPELPPGWVAEGAGMTHGYVQTGTPLISLEGDKVVTELLPQGYHTHALSSKFPGAFYLPALDASSSLNLSLKTSGGEWAGYRTIPQNAFLNEGPKFFEPGIPAQWRSFGPQ
ncbi:MAG: DUF1549 domain-containing protein [Planctomycetaceae bacterium]|nr:DUF1549 domain-containing protein [Planctomycetaceae bacterium]